MLGMDTPDDLEPLLTPPVVDSLFRFPNGRSARLARQGKLRHVVLPDGSLRFRRADVEAILEGGPLDA